MLRRVKFKPKTPPLRPGRQYTGENPSAPRLQVVPIADLRSNAVVPIVKPPPAKPGKRAPTVEEALWLGLVAGYGCIACRMDGRGIVPADVHHLLRAGRRIGHLWSIPLCPSHHRDDGRPGYIARHPWKRRFEARYGNEETLLLALQMNLEWSTA